MDKSVDVTILLALVTLLFTVRHVTLNTKPYLTYSSRVETSEAGKRLIVRLRNDGLGPALLPECAFMVQLSGPLSPASSPLPWVDFATAHLSLFGALGDALLSFTAPGTGGAIQKDREIELLVASSGAIRRVRALEMRIRFQGQFGGRHVKDVTLVPSDDVERAAIGLPPAHQEVPGSLSIDGS